jgi:hypothetical protein
MTDLGMSARAMANGTWSRRLAAVEVLGVYTLLVLYIWRLHFLFSPLWVLLLAFVIATHVLRGETPRMLGFRLDTLWPCARAYAPFVLIVALLLLGLGISLHTMRDVSPGDVAQIFVGYCGWGTFQQYLLNGYFVNRLLLVTNGSRFAGAVPLVAGALFSGAHALNPFLMVVTFVAGCIAAAAYIKYRNLYFLGLAHALIGTLLVLVVPDSISHHLVVGPAMARS